MTFQSLTQLFDRCGVALRAGDPTEALRILEGISANSLTSVSAALHAHLLARARALLGGVRPASYPLLEMAKVPPLPGITLVSACMNRHANLMKVLPTWLASEADEILIVDWSSAEPLWPLLAGIADPRLKVVRIDAEPRWILTHAFNVGLRLARYATVFKLDADIELMPEFLARNRFAAGEFVRGFWKSAVDAGIPDQRYVNGSFGAFKADLEAIGYYNERILTYGWDDSDLYARLSGALGRAGRLLADGSLRHLEQQEAQRLENQAVSQAQVLGRFAPTEHENLVNKFHELTSLEWASHSPAQDYCLEPQRERFLLGRRTTAMPEHLAEERDLARVLAMRQLATWRGDLLPTEAWKVGNSLEFARLLTQAHAIGRGAQLVEALRTRCGIHLMCVDSGPLRQSVEKTLGILCAQRPEIADVLLILADDGFRPGAADGSHPQVLRASHALVRTLAGLLDASPRSDLQSIEAVLTAGARSACTSWNIDIAAIADSAIAHALTIASNLRGRFRMPEQFAARTAFITSVYDEANLLRLLEYLACVVLNLRAVAHLVLLYEARNGLFQLIAQAICRSMDVAPGRLALLPFDRRPTFEELFAVQSLLPDGTLLVVGNADVALDATLSDLAAAARDDYVYVLSRWDIDDDGRHAHLIRLECGIPNIFSADAWIARTPFTPDFHLDYEIGSFHCDSYINNQLSRSTRYRWANPCLDVHAFHLHDSRFNSSAEKHIRDRDEIRIRYEIERQRNGGRDPLRGAPWCNLVHANKSGPSEFLIAWRPKAFVLDLVHTGLTISSLLWIHALQPVAERDEHLVVVVRLRHDDSGGHVGKLLMQYKQHFGLACLIIENEDVGFDALTAPNPHVMVRAAEAVALLKFVDSTAGAVLGHELARLVAWPEGLPDLRLLRCELAISMRPAETARFAADLRRAMPTEYLQLLEFIDGLEQWSEEARLLQPFFSDLRQSVRVAPALVGMHLPQVSLVTSLFRGGEFLHGYLENVAHAAMVAGGEVIVVDANCDGHDTAALDGFFSDHPELRRFFDIVRLDRDPGLYACWQIAIERARSEFISNANLDDRRSPLHTRRLVQALQTHPHLAGAAGSISAVKHQAAGDWFELIENQVWFHDLGEREFGFGDLYARNDDSTIRSHNIMHCMPVWRRSLHARYGYFDEERYGTSADWAFWLQCAKQGERFWLDPQAFGRYFLNPESHNRRNDAQGVKERRIIADLIGVTQGTLIKQ